MFVFLNVTNLLVAFFENFHYISLEELWKAKGLRLNRYLLNIILPPNSLFLFYFTIVNNCKWKKLHMFLSIMRLKSVCSIVIINHILPIFDAFFVCEIIWPGEAIIFTIYRGEELIYTLHFMKLSIRSRCFFYYFGWNCETMVFFRDVWVMKWSNSSKKKLAHHCDKTPSRFSLNFAEDISCWQKNKN